MGTAIRVAPGWHSARDVTPPHAGMPVRERACPSGLLGTYGRSAGTSQVLSFRYRDHPGSLFPDHPDHRMIGVEQFSVG